MEITLRFPTILQLVNFQMVTATQNFSVDTVHTTITGTFSEAEIELACNGFKAHMFNADEPDMILNALKRNV